jgi:hypothetical protein
MTEAQKQEIDYQKSIDLIMNEKLKNPQCLINLDAGASHISIKSSMTESNTNKPKSDSKSMKSSKQSKKESQSSQLRESTNKSQTSDANKSTSQMAGTGVSGTAGGTGDFGRVKNVEYVEEQLPDSMLRAIRIVTRLLTQTEYHE